MKRIAIIPARSGSKRMTDKNILKLGEKRLIYWTIDKAIESDLFDRIIVSTDSQLYADLSIERGAEAPFLRGAAYDDQSPVSHATNEALKQSKRFFGETYNTVVQLMPNCPFRTVQRLKEFVKSFEESNLVSLISAFKYGWMNPNWAFEVNSDGEPISLFPDRINKRSQDLPELYCPSGSIWITSEKNLLSSNNFYLDGWKLKEMPWIEALDIDTIEDFQMAEALLAVINKN